MQGCASAAIRSSISSALPVAQKTPVTWTASVGGGVSTKCQFWREDAATGGWRRTTARASTRGRPGLKTLDRTRCGSGSATPIPSPLSRAVRSRRSRCCHRSRPSRTRRRRGRINAVPTNRAVQASATKPIAAEPCVSGPAGTSCVLHQMQEAERTPAHLIRYCRGRAVFFSRHSGARCGGDTAGHAGIARGPVVHGLGSDHRRRWVYRWDHVDRGGACPA